MIFSSLFISMAILDEEILEIDSEAAKKAKKKRRKEVNEGNPG